MSLVRQVEKGLIEAEKDSSTAHPQPDLDPNIELVNDNTPKISRMQIDLLVNGLANNMMRVATLQFMRSVGQARMRWLGVNDGHHSLSHKPDNDKSAHDKLLKINKWFAGELGYLCKRLKETPEPSGEGNMFDNTTIMWVNELGKGNNHTLENIPFTLLGGGLGFKMGRSLHLPGINHNRLLRWRQERIFDSYIHSAIEPFCFRRLGVCHHPVACLLVKSIEFFYPELLVQRPVRGVQFYFIFHLIIKIRLSRGFQT